MQTGEVFFGRPLPPRFQDDIWYRAWDRDMPDGTTSVVLIAHHPLGAKPEWHGDWSDYEQRIKATRSE